MPFKSKAQRRKFAALLVEGKISPDTFEEWNRETGGKVLPERVTRARKTRETGKAGKTRKTRKTQKRKTQKRKTAKAKRVTKAKPATRNRAPRR